MNKLKFLILPLIFGLGLLSCGDSDKDDGDLIGGVPPPKTYSLQVDVSLHADYKVTHNDINEVVIDVKHSVADAQSLIYVVHSQAENWMYAVDGKLFRKDDIASQIKDGKFTIDRQFAAGDCYVTVIAFMNTEIGSNDISVFLKPLEKPYKQVVVRVPNDYVYYKTMVVKITSDEKDNKVAMELDKMTSELICEFYDAPKVPTNQGDYTLTVGVENIPSAFFLSTGMTLTNEEMKERGLSTYSGERIFNLKVPQNKAIVTQFHTLSNSHLPNKFSERGCLWYDFMNGKKVVKEATYVVNECTPVTNFHLYIEQLISIDVPQRETELQK